MVVSQVILDSGLLSEGTTASQVDARVRASCSSRTASTTRPSSADRNEFMVCRGSYKPIPDSYSPQLHALVAAMLQKEPRSRPTAAAILAMPYVRQHVQVSFAAACCDEHLA